MRDTSVEAIEALIEAPANRLRRLWELDALAARLSAGAHLKVRQRFGVRRWGQRMRFIEGEVGMVRSPGIKTCV